MTNYQVPEGYKQTEVGVIPEDWGIVPMGNIATFQGGYAFSSKNFREDGRYQVVKMSNLYAGELNLKRSNSFLDEISENEKVFFLNKDDILISLTGTVGKTDFGYTCRINDERNLLPNQRVSRIVVNEKSVPALIEVETKLNRFRKQFFDRAKGGTGNQTNVSTIDLATILIPLPPSIEEQRSIAQALSDVDALIAALDKLIAKNRDLKTATMQQLLTGKKRLPRFSGKWQILKVGDLFEITAGGDLVKSEYSKLHDDVHPYPIYANSVFDGGIYGYSKFKNYEGGCITVTARGTLGVAYYRATPFVAIGRLIVIKPKDELDSFFLSELINHRIEFANESTSIPQLTAPQISKCELFIPVVEEQRAIATVLSDMDNAISLLESRLTKTEAIKQGMMQELLTGRTRLI